MKKLFTILAVALLATSAFAALDSATVTTVLSPVGVSATSTGSTNTVSNVNNFEQTLFVGIGGAASTNNVAIQLLTSADKATWTTNSAVSLTNANAQSFAVNLNGLSQYWKVVAVATNGTAASVSVVAIGKPLRVNSQ